MLNVTGAWTKAGIASCVRVQGSNKQDDFLFDCGFLNSETILSKYVFISHGHIDHVGSCISHARARSLSGSVAEYYVPRDIVKHLDDARKAFEKLDNSAIPMKIIGVGPGDTFTFGTNMKVKVFPTCHRVPSQGYAVYVKKKGELLPEMRGLSGAEIKELKMMGQAILSPDTEELHMVRLFMSISVWYNSGARIILHGPVYLYLKLCLTLSDLYVLFCRYTQEIPHCLVCSNTTRVHSSSDLTH